MQRVVATGTLCGANECLLNLISEVIDVIFQDKENLLENYHVSRYFTIYITLQDMLMTWARNIKSNLILSKATSVLVQEIDVDNLPTNTSSCNIGSARRGKQIAFGSPVSVAVALTKPFQTADIKDVVSI